MEKESLPLIFKKTRKAFLLEYFCGLLLIGLVSYSYFFNLITDSILTLPVLGMGLICLGAAELPRWRYRYKITGDKVTITKGIIMKHRKHVYFHPLGFVVDINVKQNMIQRLLNYGTIYVKGSAENSLEITDTTSPHQIMEIIEKLIEKNRTPSTKRGNLPLGKPKNLLKSAN